MPISIHALLAESDNLRVVDGSKSSIISIHALLAESDRNGFAMRWNTCISIHALLAESDYFVPALKLTAYRFLSTLSLRRATWVLRKVPLLGIISIHALLAESDSKSAQNNGALLHI